MKSLDDIIKEAINESLKGEGSNIFEESIRQSERDIRRSSIDHSEEFIEACKFLAENDAHTRASLLAVAKSTMVIGGALGYYMSHSNEEKQDSLLFMVAKLPDMYASQILKMAKRIKDQKQTIENLTAALAYGKEATSEA